MTLSVLSAHLLHLHLLHLMPLIISISPIPICLDHLLLGNHPRPVFLVLQLSPRRYSAFRPLLAVHQLDTCTSTTRLSGAMWVRVQVDMFSLVFAQPLRLLGGIPLGHDNRLLKFLLCLPTNNFHVLRELAVSLCLVARLPVMLHPFRCHCFYYFDWVATVFKPILAHKLIHTLKVCFWNYSDVVQHSGQ